MGTFDVRGGELKKLIKLAKKQPVTFAYNPGNGPKDDYFGMDRRKPAKVVGKAAKDEGVGGKAAFGTAKVDGKILKLTCVRTVPSIAKKLKKYLSSEKVRLNIQVMDENGSVLEADIDENLPDDPDLMDSDEQQQDAPEQETQAQEQPQAQENEEEQQGSHDANALREELKILGGRIQALQPDTAKVFAKHYKQLLEFFKAQQFDKLVASLGKVTRALDKLESKQPTLEEKQDPNKPKWEALQPKIQVIYDKAIAASPTAADKLQAAWAQIIALAKAGNNGKAIAAAKKLVPALQKLAQPAPKAQTQDTQTDSDQTSRSEEDSDEPEAQEQPGTQTFEQAKDALDKRLASMDKALQVARRVLPGEAGKIDKLSDQITGLSDETNLQAARKAAEDLQAIADAGTQRAAEIEAALQEVELVRGYIDHMGQEFETNLGDTPPEHLSKPLNDAKDGLSGKDEIDPDKIEKSVQDAMDQLKKNEQEIAQLLADKAAWEALLDLFEPRVKALEKHDKHNEQPVKDRIKTVTDGLTAAKALADQHKYKEAAAALPPLAKTCAEAEKYADACSQYDDLYSHRKTVVDKMLADHPLGGPLHDLVKGTIRKIKEDFDDAKAKGIANPPEYEKAMEILKPMATRVQEVMWRAERATNYAAQLAHLKSRVTEREKHPDASEIKQFIDPMKQLLADAEVSKTKSFVKSLSLLERASSLNNTLYRAAERSKEFKEAYKSATRRIKRLKEHVGKNGITKHTSRLETELATAKTKGEEAKFLHGQKICDKIRGEYDGLKKKAEDYKAYLDAKELLKTTKEAWDKNYIDKVGGLTDQVSDLEGKVISAVTNEDYKLAKKHIDQAKELADSAKQKADLYANNAKAMDNAKSNIQSGSGDYSGVITQLEGLQNSISGFDKDNLYTSEITNATNPIQTARGKIGKNPQDDQGIKSDLESVHSNLNTLLEKTVQQSIYRTLHAGHKGDYDTIKGTNRGDALEPETDAIDKCFEDAKQQAETTKDPFAAVKEIGKLAALIKDMERKAANYDAYDALLKGSIKRRDDWFDAADGTYGKPKDVLDKEFTAYGQQKTAADTEGKNKKWKEALEKLKKAKTDADLYKKMFTDYKEALKTKKEWITDILSPVDTSDIVKDMYAGIKPKIDRVDELIVDRQYDQSMALAKTLRRAIWYALDKVARHTEIAPKHAAAKAEVQKVFDVRCPPIEADYVRAKHLFDQVEAEMAANTYVNAMKIVDQIVPMCQELIRIGTEYKVYKQGREAADKAVGDLAKDYPKDDTVDLHLDRLNARLTKLNGEEAKRGFAALKPVAQTIADDAAKVAAAARAQAKLGDLEQGMKDAAPTDTANFDTDLQKLKEALAALKGHAGKDCQQVKDHTARIDRLLGEAETDYTDAGDIVTARAKLADAATSLTRANLLGEQFVLLDAQVKALETRHDDAQGKHTEPAAIKGLFTASSRNIVGAKGAVDKGNFNTALGFVKAAEEPLDKAIAIAKHHAAYKVKLGEVKPRVDALVGHSAHYSVAEEVDEARLYLSGAEEFAAQMKPKEAIENLDRCAKICTLAEIKADMHANEAPDEDKIKKLLETKNGIKELDKIFETLDPSVKRKACKKVLQLRFGMELKQTTDKAGSTPDNNLEKMAPNVTRLFSLMADLDDAHTRDNPSVSLVRRFGNQKGTSSFGRSKGNDDKMTKKITLRIGRAEMPEETVIGQEWQLGDVDENCKPVDDTPAKSFNWTTLHEIGHAVDDKYGVMNRNGSSKKYGNWKEYLGDVSEISRVAANHFSYDKSYIASYLSKPGGNYAKPEPDNGVDSDTWEQRRLEAEAWCDSIRSDKTIWYSATETSRLQIDGRVYQEAYSNKWVSYDFAARSQGVRGYQFRAPGEWFADIYAAFHSGKMNPKHPAREWLEKDMNN